MWCETMTSGERMGALMRGERPDRVPVIPFLSGHAAVVCGQPLTRISDDAEESFRCQLLCQEMYGHDGSPLYAYASAGGWEFGGDIEFPVKKYSGAIVVTRTPIQTEDDVYSLKVPEDVSKAGALPIALGIARKQAEYGMPVTLQIGAPLTWTGSVIGEERMMNWLIKKPEAVHVVLDKVTAVLDQGGRVLRQGVRGGKAHGLPRRRHRDQQADLSQAVRDLLAPVPAEDQQPRHRVGDRHASSSTSAASRTRTSSSGSRCP